MQFKSILYISNQAIKIDLVSQAVPHIQIPDFTLQQISSVFSKTIIRYIITQNIVGDLVMCSFPLLLITLNAPTGHQIH